jgi:tetratricopeptide (TPR) repeat protein
MIVSQPESIGASAIPSGGSPATARQAGAERGAPPNPPCIPDYQLVRRIGQGSYGEVWLARSVMGACRAIKIVFRSRFDSDRPFDREFEGLRKFEPISRADESQVDILHVGRGEGYFYYVMELADDASSPGPQDAAVHTTPELKPGAESRPLNPQTYVPRTLKLELARRRRLPVNECIDISLALTRALGNLHSHGLIHRDVKLSNIIFIHGQPKLADIGLIADQDATCSFVGTEGYLPPEGPGSVGADLYGLGKVLYEISTGKDRREFPELPICAAPGSKPISLKAAVQPPMPLSPEEEKALIELNAVVLKACKPDPRHRYQTATEMRQDLLLLLAGKSVRRTHAIERRLAMMTRIGMATAAALVLCAVPLFFAVKEAHRATSIARQENSERLRAEANEAKAQSEAAKKMEVARFLKDVLHEVGPSVDSAMLKQILNRTSDRITRDLSGKPDNEVQLRLALAEIYDELGLYAPEMEMACRALEVAESRLPDNPLLAAKARCQLGTACCGARLFDEADGYLRAALGTELTLLGPENIEVARSLNEIGKVLLKRRHWQEAAAVVRQALALRRKLYGNEHPVVSESLTLLADALQDRLLEAEALYYEALIMQKRCIPGDHPYTAACLNNVANVLRNENKLSEAEQMLTEGLVMARHLWGDEHVKVAEFLQNLAFVHRDQNKLAEAEADLRETLRIERKLLGEDNAATPLDNLVDVLLRQGKADQAKALVDDVLSPEREQQWQSSGLFRARADLFARQGLWDRAIADSCKVIEFNPSHHWHYFTLACMLAARNDLEAYQGLCRRIIHTFPDPDDPGVAEVIAKSCLLLPDSGTDLKSVARLASFAADSARGHRLEPWFELCHGLAEYRQGRFKEALDIMHQLEGQIPASGDNFALELYAISAMAQFQLTHREEALEPLRMATDVAQTRLPHLDSRDLGTDWYDLLIGHTLLREAKALIAGKPQAPEQQALNRL